MGDYDVYLKQEQDGWQLYGPDCTELAEFYAEIAQVLNQLAVSSPNLNDSASSIKVDSGTHAPVINPIPNLMTNNHVVKYPSELTNALCQTSPFRLMQAFAPQWSVQQYQSAFEKIQQYLIQGDCYQVNLTQPFKALLDGQLINALDALMTLSKASYAGYLQYKDFELLSCSPELFIEFKAGGEMLTRPIKGTRPRHHDAQQDAALKQQLFASEKDRAENLMIVDLLRNDLGHYAQTGSVSVPALFEVQSFAQVHHLVSEIRATLKPDVSVLDVLFNALPGGSITGAPKIRAMQIIDELEAEARGAYCGSMGYLNYDNTGQFNILIRSLQKRGDTLNVWAGGGITIASKCEDEYQECLDKVGAILACVNELGNAD
ncbi:MAG: aminodeoxychorismate synthase component I [Moraxellaceae bacterium]|nr:MAG: aminodeoxychorismate synthase component I [Moraxellaceae bacterium]